MYRPRAEIGVFILNSTSDQVLLGKKIADGLWSLPGGNLKFGETFEECALRELSNQLKLVIKDKTRLYEICTFNALDKEKKFHALEINFLLKLTEDEEKLIINNDKFIFDSWKWNKSDDFYNVLENSICTIQMFIKKFNIKTLDDILKMSLVNF